MRAALRVLQACGGTPGSPLPLLSLSLSEWWVSSAVKCSAAASSHWITGRWPSLAWPGEVLSIPPCRADRSHHSWIRFSVWYDRQLMREEPGRPRPELYPEQFRAVESYPEHALHNRDDIQRVIELISGAVQHSPMLSTAVESYPILYRALQSSPMPSRAVQSSPMLSRAIRSYPD